METIFFPGCRRLNGRYAATIGFFDGVHLGHRAVIDGLKTEACQRGLRSMVITFDRHPRQVVQTDYEPLLLATLSEKRDLLAATGVDMLVVLRFDREVAALSAHDFMADVLKRQLNVDFLLMGYDNRFGHNRAESFDDYLVYGRNMGIEVMGAEPLVTDGLTASSSLIRSLLVDGRVEQAARLLGRPYSIKGMVVHGEQIGRTLGFPTANLALPDDCKLIPGNGVYAIRCAEGLQGMMNIGLRPTFNGHEQTLEAHLFDFKGDLYGQQLQVEFVARLRSEQHFGDVNLLKKQMMIDAQTAKRILNQ